MGVGENVHKLAPGECLRSPVASNAHEAKARHILRATGVAQERVESFRFLANRGWTHGSGPVFTRYHGETAMVHSGFNAWARYPDRQKDNAVLQCAARALGCRIFAARFQCRPFVPG